MIALLKNRVADEQNQLKPDGFLAMMPQIRRQASVAFRHQNAEAREELIQEVTANAYRAWVHLVKQGRTEVARPTPLAQYAVRQVRDGRRVGSQQNVQDILSPRAARIHGLTIKRIDRFDPQSGDWNEMLVEDRKAGPAATAAVRIDVSAWLRTLTTRNRRMANALALGETTGEVARKFGVCPGRVSQLRVWLRAHWEKFQGGQQEVVQPSS